jgi:hypothetical protein
MFQPFPLPAFATKLRFVFPPCASVVPLVQGCVCNLLHCSISWETQSPETEKLGARETGNACRINGFSEWVHRPDSVELEDNKNTMFRKLDLFPSSGEGRHLLCWGP